VFSERFSRLSLSLSCVSLPLRLAAAGVKVDGGTPVRSVLSGANAYIVLILCA
jgi:hypothetical protein